MAYQIAAADVHKKMLAIVVADVSGEGEYQFERRKFGATPDQMRLCQAKSNRGRRGRKNDFADGERMIKRLVAQELVLSFVPDPEQRLWRTVTRLLSRFL